MANERTITVLPGESFEDVANIYTIGGNAYGVAIARYNGYEDGKTKPGGGVTILIPVNWLKPQFQKELTITVSGGGATAPTLPRPVEGWKNPWVLGGIGVVVIALLMNKKR